MLPRCDMSLTMFARPGAAAGATLSLRWKLESGRYSPSHRHRSHEMKKPFACSHALSTVDRTSPATSPHMIMYCRVLHTVRLPSSEWCTSGRTFSHKYTCRLQLEVLLRAQTMVGRRDSAQAGNRTSTCSWGWARSRPARSQAARHPKQRKPRQTSPVTNLVDHMRLK